MDKADRFLVPVRHSVKGMREGLEYMAPRRGLRPTILDGLPQPGRNLYCNRSDLTNEASVETFFAERLIRDLGYEDAQVKMKTSVSEIMVGCGAKKVRYKPDYVLLYKGIPRWVLDAKAPHERLEDWEEQAAGYC